LEKNLGFEPGALGPKYLWTFSSLGFHLVVVEQGVFGRFKTHTFFSQSIGKLLIKGILIVIFYSHRI